MAYATLADYRAYLASLTSGSGPSSYSAADDTFQTGCLAAAQQFIEDETFRHFEAVTETRYYRVNAVSYQDPQVLILDDDLLTITTLTNANGDVVNSSQYWLLPDNWFPKYAIQLKFSSVWQFPIDGRVSVAGTWGYMASANADVKRITYRLAYLEQQRRSATGAVAVLGQTGIVQYEAEVPKDIAYWLRKHTRGKGNK